MAAAVDQREGGIRRLRHPGAGNEGCLENPGTRGGGARAGPCGRIAMTHIKREMPWEAKHLKSREEILLKREWLVTNGLGGYASGTVAGVPTRRYHGLLIAAYPTPFGR